MNVPADATVADLEQLFIESWQRGLKAVAVYRDNCKVDQPLSQASENGSENGSGTDAVKSLRRCRCRCR